MKSIGLFWSEESPYFPENKGICPYGIAPKQGLPVIYIPKNKKFELQINLWNCQAKNLEKGDVFDFKAIDVGVISPISTKQLAFLFPFKIKKRDFEDLTDSLCHHPELLCSIFNEDLKVSTDATDSYELVDGAKKLLMYELSTDNIRVLEYDESNHVTLLIFTINSNLEEIEDRQLFVRFRLNLQNLSCFAIKKHISNDWLQSAFSSSCLFDIRVNDMREMSKKKREIVELYGCKTPEFKKIHYLYMADSEENIISDGSMPKDSRLLEKDKWNSYLGENLVFVSDNIAHHWKAIERKNLSFKSKVEYGNGRMDLKLIPSTVPVKSFSLFYKTVYSDVDKNRIGLYVSIVVLLGVLSSAIVTGVDFLIEKSTLSVRTLCIGAAIIVALVSSYLYFSYKSIKR